MSDSAKAIAEDLELYEELCKKYNQPQQKLYSIHHIWLLKLHRGETTLSFNEYQRMHTKNY